MATMHDDAPTGAMTAVAGEDARDDLAWAHALVGTELGRYRIESLRGVGGFGAVCGVLATPLVYASLKRMLKPPRGEPPHSEERPPVAGLE
jgi:hypothetical protein